MGSDGDGPFWDGAREILAKYRREDRLLNGSLAVIRVDWLQNNEDIEKAFKRWVKEERPADFAMYSMKGKSAVRGDMLEAALRALGAWTLSRTRNSGVPSDLTRSAALELEGAHELTAADLLYTEESDFSRAATKAERRIELITPWRLFFDYSDNTNLSRNCEFSRLEENGCTVVIGHDGVRFYRAPRVRKRTR